MAKAVAAVVCFAARRKPAAMTLLAAAVLVAGSDISLRPELARYRSFFGVHRIETDAGNTVHFLMHGNTTHGAQFTDPRAPARALALLRKEWSRRPGDRQPAWRGCAFAGRGDRARRRRHGLPQPEGRGLDFLRDRSRNPRDARDPRYFSFLADCAPDAKIVLGDGRLKLAAAPDATYRLLVLDAFGSDSIPVHLLTRQAFDLYLKKLQPGGLLLLHLSNRNVGLLPAVARLAADRGLTGREQFFPGQEPASALISSSEWAVVARNESDLGALAADARWRPFPDTPGMPVWTDDYVDILSVIHWPWR